MNCLIVEPNLELLLDKAIEQGGGVKAIHQLTLYFWYYYTINIEDYSSVWPTKLLEFVHVVPCGP